MKISILCDRDFDNYQLVYDTLNKRLNNEEDILIINRREKKRLVAEVYALELCPSLSIKYELHEFPTQNDKSDATFMFDVKGCELHHHLVK